MKIKTQSIVVIGTCVILFTITGVSGNSTCTGMNIKCSKNDECCSKTCSYQFLSFESVCADNSTLFETISSFFVPKVEQDGFCSYKVPVNKNADVELYNKYGLNAAHPVLSTNTKVEVTANNKKVLLTINNRQSSTRGSILELSDEAAKVLDINNEGLVQCTVSVPVIENNSVLKAIQYLLPYLGLMILLKWI